MRVGEAGLGCEVFLCHQPRVATLGARTLTILPAVGSASAAASAPPARAAQPASAPVASQHPATPAAEKRPAPAHVPSEWEWVSIGLAAVWLATLGSWLWSRRSRPARNQTPPPRQAAAAPAPDLSRERAAFRAACERNDAHAARVHLLAWATALWGAAPAGVNAIAARIGDPAIADLLRDLDRACYSSGGWSGAPLAAALTELPTPSGKNAPARAGLAPLYP